MTAKTIDRKKRITDFIKIIDDIAINNRKWVKKEGKYKILDNGDNYGKRHKEIANECTNEIRYLGEGKTKEECDSDNTSQKIVPATFLSYLTDYRNAIQDLNHKGLNTKKDIKKIQKQYKETDLSSLNASMPELRNNLVNLKNKYRDTNQDLYVSLKKLRIESHAFYLMRGKAPVRERVNEKSKINRKYKHSNQKIVNKARIDQILNELGDSKHWIDLTIFIAMASGRRSIEILKTGSFRKSKKDCVFFEGQAKTKTRDDAGSFIIPSLVSPKKLMDTHDRLRAILDKEVFYDKGFNDLTNDEINGATAGRLNNKVKSIFDGDKFVFKDLRALYAKQASTKYHDPKKETIAVFYSSILGHAENDIATQLSYQGLVVSDEEIETSKIEYTIDEKNHGNSEYKTLKEIEAFDKTIKDLQGTPVKVPKKNGGYYDEKKVGKAEERIHEFVKKTLQDNKDAVITQTFLGKSKAMGGLGASRPAVRIYLFITGIDQKNHEK